MAGGSWLCTPVHCGMLSPRRPQVWPGTATGHFLCLPSMGPGRSHGMAPIPGQLHDISVGLQELTHSLNHFLQGKGQATGDPGFLRSPWAASPGSPWGPMPLLWAWRGALQGPEQLWRGPIFASLFLGALGSSCRKGMLAICWCSKLAPHPGRAAQCQSLVKTLARAAFPMPGVSSGGVGMWPSAQPEAARGRGGLLSRPQPGLPGGPHLLQACSSC